MSKPCRYVAVFKNTIACGMSEIKFHKKLNLLHLVTSIQALVCGCIYVCIYIYIYIYIYTYIHIYIYIYICVCVYANNTFGSVSYTYVYKKCLEII